ncbi:hypothetical protein FGO68_gene994 [Halteria grandinella]|uniref:Uncharacterized protein n=1 Tax=Halteria grandinella TaxID=5974 RepID=A0A8J8SUS5_HALGN|nr:hypothetical protein FGO68_gene994 [Halteria grandinella]
MPSVWGSQMCNPKASMNARTSRAASSPKKWGRAQFKMKMILNPSSHPSGFSSSSNRSSSSASSKSNVKQTPVSGFSQTAWSFAT